MLFHSAISSFGDLVWELKGGMFEAQWLAANKVGSNLGSRRVDTARRSWLISNLIGVSCLTSLHL